MLKSLTKFVGGSDERVVKKLMGPAAEINELEPEFEALSDDDLRKIMSMLVTQLNQNLVNRDLRISVSPEVVDWIIEITCKDRSYGARPLRRAIQRYIEDPLSEELIRGRLEAGEIEVYLEDAGLAYRMARQEAIEGQQLA